MNKTNLSSPSLSRLYRRLTAQSAAEPVLDAADLAGAGDGTLASDRRDSVAQALASSPVHADVAHLLRDLQSESQALASNVARTNRDTAHRRHQRDVRRVAASRRFGGVSRWAALAACLVAVVGAWTLRQAHEQPDAMTTHSRTVAHNDVIFNSRDEIFGVGMEPVSTQHGQKVRHEGDRLFHGAFGGG
jgi:hypothetical protein